MAGSHGDICIKLVMYSARVLNDYIFKHGDS
jgi:hypothetical protein